MIIAKLFLFALPVIFASMLFFANSAAASPVDSVSVTTGVNAASVQAIHQLPAVNPTDKSNPIMDQLGCKCAYCVQAQLQFEGKLSISDIL